MNIGYMHLYAQEQWHDDAYVIGDETALRALRDAIDKALSGGTGTSLAFAGDGEGYRVRVVVRGPERLPMPYTDEIAAEVGAVFPDDLISTLDAMKGEDAEARG